MRALTASCIVVLSIICVIQDTRLDKAVDRMNYLEAVMETHALAITENGKYVEELVRSTDVRLNQADRLYQYLGKIVEGY